MQNVIEVASPFAQNLLGRMRDRSTDTSTFRSLSDRLCTILLSNAFFQNDLELIEITTPVIPTKILTLAPNFAVICVLRAGIAMLDPALRLLPSASIGFAGLKRDEETAIASEYYWNIPFISKNDIILIVDPMLGTGGSLLHVLRKLRENYQNEIRVVSALAAPEGIKTVHLQFPEVIIITGSIDERLNSKHYIVPGLGDYGDRYFGTETV
jgi:uracil phosphoribosyltransferase